MKYVYRDPFPGDGLKIGHSKDEGMAVQVFSRYAAEQYIPESNQEICISIRSASANGVDDFPPTLSKMFNEVLYLVFDDTTQSDFYSGPMRGITEAQLDDLVTFVLKHQDKKKLVIHCYAGMNRSRSMAEAICRTLKLPYSYTINHYKLFEQVSNALKKRLQEG